MLRRVTEDGQVMEGSSDKMWCTGEGNGKPLQYSCLENPMTSMKGTGMGEFNSDDHYIYYCGQESFRRNGVTLKINKRVQNAVLGSHLKNSRMISVRFQGKPLNITVIQVYFLTSNAEEAEVERLYEDL